MRWFCLMLAVFCSSVAFADQPPKGAKEQAQELYLQGDYEAALIKFKEAYALLAEPEVLYQMAQCQKRLGRSEEAVLSLCTFLEKAPQTELKPQVETELTELSGVCVAPQEPQSQALSLPTSAASTPTTNQIVYSEADIYQPPPPRTLLLPGALLASGAILGTTAFVMRLREEASGGEYSNADRFKGLAVSVSADLLFLSGGVSAWLALKKHQKNNE
jgi:tetratricopeptide (TPR) repeat protein